MSAGIHTATHTSPTFSEGILRALPISIFNSARESAAVIEAGTGVDSHATAGEAARAKRPINVGTAVPSTPFPYFSTGNSLPRFSHAS